MSWFAPLLEPLLVVAAATLDDDGTLVEANTGFRRLLDAAGWRPGASLARYFRQPALAALARAPAGADGLVHKGLLTIGDHDGAPRTLRARVWRVDATLRVLAEYDIEEMERLNDKVLELNRDYAEAQHQLAQTNFGLRQREAEILRLSLTDQLTGVGNRRRLEQAMATEIARVSRTGEPLSAMIADLDHFKRVNDGYGHDAGDKVLAAFGEMLRRQTRQTDIVARYGGEEFVALMPRTGLDVAIAIAERIRATFAAQVIEPLPQPVTGSFGVAELVAGEAGDALLRRADKALYSAKLGGRNRVVAG